MIYEKLILNIIQIIQMNIELKEKFN